MVNSRGYIITLNLASAVTLMSFLLVYGCGSAIKGVPISDMTPAQEQISNTPELILGPGDKVEISVYRHDDLAKTLQVDPSGRIMYPLIGDIKVSGLTVFGLRDTLRDKLAKFIVDPQVVVNVSTTLSQKVIVLGEVKSPGYFQADGSITALEAISRAGGFTTEGQSKTVMLIRSGQMKPALYSLNLQKALEDGDLRQNLLLQRGDIVYVPRTLIADVDSFFKHMSTILQPIVLLETGIFLEQQITSTSSGKAAIAP